MLIFRSRLRKLSLTFTSSLESSGMKTIIQSQQIDARTPDHESISPMIKFASRTTLAALLLACTASCSSFTLDLDYAFRLDQQNTDEELVFVDKDFKFTFQAVESGVYFQVENLSEKLAYIDWDNCFFVEPDGNTYNALNTDILDESDEVASRTARTSAHRTQVPINSTVKRFTTATVNMSEHDLVTVSEIGSMLSTTNFQWNQQSGWGWSANAQSTTSASYARSLTISSVEYWSARRYWLSDVEAKARDDMDGDSLRAVSEHLLENPSIGFGLRMLHGEEARDFRFDFVLDAVFASRLLKLDGVPAAEQPRELTYYAVPEDGWKWRAGGTLE
jgi:hypothetical protein